MAELVVRGLDKAFGGQPVLRGVSFEARDGEFCVLLGPSGCGKSTTLRIVAGLERQDRGEVFLGGREVSELAPRERDVAMVFQSYALYPHMDVRDNLAFALRLRGTPRQETERRVREAARLLGIEELLGRRARELSGGQRQRVAIGRAIVRQPRLFLFDEPLSNLDAPLRAAMRIELARLHRQLGTTMVYVTHDQVEAMTLGSRIVVFDRGEVQQVAPPKTVYEEPANLVVAEFVGSPRINTLAGTVALRGGTATFQRGDLAIALPPGRGGELAAGREVVLGVRPEALLPGEGPVRGAVEFVEDLGAEVIVSVSVGGARWAARLPAGTRAVQGETLSFAIQPAGLHLFLEGRRLAGARAAPGAAG